MTNRINILQLIYKLEVGGAEKVVCALAERLDDKRFNCRVASFKGGALVNELEAAGIPVHVLNKKGRFNFVFFLDLIHLLIDYQIDIIHSHTFSPNLWARIATKLVRRPITITTEHTIATHKKTWQCIIDRLLNHFSERIICVSEEVKKSHQELSLLPTNKAVVIHNGVSGSDADVLSPDDRSALRLSLGLDTNVPVIVSVGRLAPPKGYQFLLDAMARLKNRGILVQCLIVGDGPLRQSLEKQAIESGIAPIVFFAGFRNDVRHMLKIADYYVSSSIREGFPVSVLEAMAEGKSIIATDVGGNKEAIQNNITGILVPPRQGDRLAEAVEDLLKNADKSKALGGNAKQAFIDKFHVNHMIEMNTELYEALIRERGRKPQLK